MESELSTSRPVSQHAVHSHRESRRRERTDRLSQGPPNPPRTRRQTNRSNQQGNDSEVRRLRQIEPNIIDESPVNSGFKANQILFGTWHDNLEFVEGNFDYPSLYFPKGRIRLSRIDGPEIFDYGKVVRLTMDLDIIDEARENQLKRFVFSFQDQVTQNAVSLDDVADRITGNYRGCRKFRTLSDPPNINYKQKIVLELFKVNGRLALHTSLGDIRPLPFTIKQTQLNALYSAAQSRSRHNVNWVIQNDPLLIRFDPTIQGR